MQCFTIFLYNWITRLNYMKLANRIMNILKTYLLIEVKQWVYFNINYEEFTF